MDQGEIAERGKHQELLEKKGLYFDLYDMQFKMHSLHV
jgi:ATP-binding cassette subfamily B protein